MPLHKVTQNDTFCTLSREDIIPLVQESIIEHPNENPFDFRLSSIEAVERFAALVSEREREACVELCEEQMKSYMSKRYTTDPLGGFRERFAAEQCAIAIRARGEI